MIRFTALDRAMMRGICFKGGDGLSSEFDAQQTPQMIEQSRMAIQEYNTYTQNFQPDIHKFIGEEVAPTGQKEARAAGMANADVAQQAAGTAGVDPNLVLSPTRTAAVAGATGQAVNAGIIDSRNRGIEQTATMANKGQSNLNLANAGVKREAQSSLEQALTEAKGKQGLAETGASWHRKMGDEFFQASMGLISKLKPEEDPEEDPKGPPGGNDKIDDYSN
jgi:hypothetical protein